LYWHIKIFFHFLSHNRSTASSKASSPQFAVKCFLVQISVPSLSLKVIHWLLTSSSRHV